MTSRRSPPLPAALPGWDQRLRGWRERAVLNVSGRSWVPASWQTSTIGCAVQARCCRCGRVLGPLPPPEQHVTRPCACTACQAEVDRVLATALC